MQCCKNEAILKLKRDFCPYFSAKIFKRTRQTLLIPKIYILDYIKKYMKPFRFFGTQKKTPANLRIFQNLRFLRGHYSKKGHIRIFFILSKLFSIQYVRFLLLVKKIHPAEHCSILTSLYPYFSTFLTLPDPW